MVFKKQKLKGKAIPTLMQQIPSSPKELFIIGNLESLLDRPRLSVVGSRKVTPYGIAVTRQLVTEVANRGVVIISGLALGVDAVAHQACLAAQGQTIAILPCGLDEIYPRSHTQLAQHILKQGGALVSEYPEGSAPFKANFVARNRLVAGFGDALLVTEAAEKSGTLHTVNFALEQGKTVFAVPGNITSSQSKGTNNLIKTGASPVTEASDILRELGVEDTEQQTQLFTNSDEERVVLELLHSGVTDGTVLLKQSKLPPAIFNQTITMLEITGRIQALGNNQWSRK